MDNSMIELARQAIKDGKTPGRFIRENTSSKDSRQVLQDWSDAYFMVVAENLGKEEGK